MQQNPCHIVSSQEAPTTSNRRGFFIVANCVLAVAPLHKKCPLYLPTTSAREASAGALCLQLIAYCLQLKAKTSSAARGRLLSLSKDPAPPPAPKGERQGTRGTSCSRCRTPEIYAASRWPRSTGSGRQAAIPPPRSP